MFLFFYPFYIGTSYAVQESITIPNVPKRDKLLAQR
jgi:hypothetical protein